MFMVAHWSARRHVPSQLLTGTPAVPRESQRGLSSGGSHHLSLLVFFDPALSHCGQIFCPTPPNPFRSPASAGTVSGRQDWIGTIPGFSKLRPSKKRVIA